MKCGNMIGTISLTFSVINDAITIRTDNVNCMKEMHDYEMISNIFLNISTLYIIRLAN